MNKCTVIERNYPGLTENRMCVDDAVLEHLTSEKREDGHTGRIQASMVCIRM